ncbi:MAG: cytochrome c oxidase subunit II [Candidatus Dormibacteraeota bacterium]|nr:cytochrome c oxidase subunit II [Candidatus Dormibacteraeota bacterium]
MPAVSVSPLDCAGPNACAIVDIYTGIFWIAMAVLVIVGGLLIYAALRFRRRDEVEPRQVHGNTRLEIVWTLIPVVIVSYLFIRTTLRMDYVRNGPPPALTVKVVGVQFAWQYIYPDSRVRSDTLVIPIKQPIQLQVTSRDVLHAFWAPRLGGQIYAIPGQQNHGWLQADRPGVYLGECNELCGVGHYAMQVKVQAMTPDAYQAWYAQRQKQASGGGAPPPGGGPATATKISGVPATQTVGETDDFKFKPVTTTVKAGDVVQWVNQGSSVHNVKFDNGQVPSSDDMNGGDKFEVKFSQPGSYRYICTFHTAFNMAGTITVTP